MIKPRIRMMWPGMWLCFTVGRLSIDGYQDRTPEAAYLGWLKNFGARG